MSKRSVPVSVKKTSGESELATRSGDSTVSERPEALRLMEVEAANLRRKSPQTSLTSSSGASRVQTASRVFVCVFVRISCLFIQFLDVLVSCLCYSFVVDVSLCCICASKQTTTASRVSPASTPAGAWQPVGAEVVEVRGVARTPHLRNWTDASRSNTRCLLCSCRLVLFNTLLSYYLLYYDWLMHLAQICAIIIGYCLGGPSAGALSQTNKATFNAVHRKDKTYRHA